MANNLEREQARHILLSKFQEAEEKAEREGWLDADEINVEKRGSTSKFGESSIGL